MFTINTETNEKNKRELQDNYRIELDLWFDLEIINEEIGIAQKLITEYTRIKNKEHMIKLHSDRIFVLKDLKDKKDTELKLIHTKIYELIEAFMR